MTQPIREGELLAGKYKVERVLGQGGMGVVVAATHQQLDQKVALKFLLPEGAGNAESVARFLREARAAVRLRSEHVAKVLDVGTLESGAPFIVMEYLEGRDLGSLIEGGPLPVPEACEYVLQACEALAEAHAAGIVHRDLKPDNLFLTQRSDGSACIKVLDFGISKMTEQGSPQATKTSALMGTPLYMSPEQLRSSKKVDARSDLWSLGMILYELLTGQVAFRRETLPELCAAILMDPLIPPRALRASLPEGLDALIQTCLEKDPDHRFPSLREFTAALAPFAPEGAAVARRVDRTLGGARTALLSVPAATPTDPERSGAPTLGPTDSPSTHATPPAETLVALLRTATAEPGDPTEPTGAGDPPAETSSSPPPPVSSPELPAAPARRPLWLLAPALLLPALVLGWYATRSPEPPAPSPPPVSAAASPPALSPPPVTSATAAPSPSPDPVAATAPPPPAEKKDSKEPQASKPRAPERPSDKKPTKPAAPAKPAPVDFGGRQ